jgi:hypothetical protein
MPRHGAGGSGVTPPSGSSPSAGPSAPRAVWAAIFLLTAALVAAAAGFLAWAGGAEPPHALLTAGGAFGATALLLIALAHYLDGSSP